MSDITADLSTRSQIIEGNISASGTSGSGTVSVTVGTTTTGEPGTEASVTNSGTASALILDFAVPQGPKGDTGASGTNGKDGADGAQGPKGDKGDTGTAGTNGANGTDGKTPVKGTDYWTAADKQEIVDDTKTSLGYGTVAMAITYDDGTTETITVVTA